ncbi:DUF3365 domain-containing protein [Candidatus Albibeggiatoa sp. nov. NOAA]|uniref:sensor histidine kinase n=1 Tax=Candidatus Albibeggiatoa sp. nov. NOAA TaxID=3162724 RepID=UPI0032F53D4A|nr:DUF3365 domain-containing protein [Thiotrichaceae bacterium]
MSLKFKFASLSLIFLIIIMSTGAWYLKQLQTTLLEKEARNRIEMVINFSQASRDYIRDYLRPTLQQKLPDDFLFEGNSSTFFTKAVLDIFNQKMPEYYYKQATISPLNLDNLADEFETKIIQKFKSNTDLEEFLGYREVNHKKNLFLARPIYITPDCLSCHGKPENMPPVLIKRYGNTHGFNWEVGELVSALIIYVSIEELQQDISDTLWKLLFTFVLLTAFIATLFYFVFEYIVEKPIKSVAQFMQQKAANPKQEICIKVDSHGEVGEMVESFNYMSQQLCNTFVDLEHKNRMLQDSNNFLAITAHDLKSPLCAVQGLAELVEEDLHDMPEAEIINCMGKIQRSSKQMFNLITNLLDVNSIESGKIKVNLSTSNLHILVTELVNMHQHQAKVKGIQVHLLMQNCQTCPVYTDSNIIYQVLDNLISNAIKYSPFDKNVYVTLEQSEQHIYFKIQDEGFGFTEADKNRLFGKFQQLSNKPTNKEHSTGLGLFIVKKLVEALDGDVWCESEPNQGAMFIVQLPKIDS